MEKRLAGRPSEPIVGEEKAKALALLAVNEGNLARTSRETGLTPYKLRRLRDTNLELYQETQRRIAEGLLDTTLLIGRAVLDEVHNRVTDPDKIEEMKLKDLMVVAGISIDKVNVMTNVRGKFGPAQRAAEDYTKLSDDEIAGIIDVEFRDVTADEGQANEDMPDTPKDELPFRSKRVSPLGTLLHSRSDSE